jgi:hypothetical protein
MRFSDTPVCSLILVVISGLEESPQDAGRLVWDANDAMVNRDAFVGF